MARLFSFKGPQALVEIEQISKGLYFVNRQEGDDWWILSKHETYHAAFDALIDHLGTTRL